jgi:hypothetical protein
MAIFQRSAILVLENKFLLLAAYLISSSSLEIIWIHINCYSTPAIIKTQNNGTFRTILRWRKFFGSHACLNSHDFFANQNHIASCASLRVLLSKCKFIDFNSLARLLLNMRCTWRCKSFGN